MSVTDETLLGCVLLDNRVYSMVHGEITGAEFADPRLGLAFDGIMARLHAGETVGTVGLTDYFEEWGVRGIAPDAPFEWTGRISGQWAPYVIVGDVVRAIRTEYTRRRARELANRLSSDLSDASNEPEELLANLRAEIDDVKARRRQEFDVMPLRTILNLVETPEQWVIPDLLEKQDRLILTGEEGGGKSSFIRQLLICGAAGVHPFEELQQITPIRSLAIDVENTALQWKRAVTYMRGRAKAMGTADPADTMHVVVRSRMNLLDPRDVADMLTYVDEIKPDLVSIGPLYRLVNGSLNDEEVASRVLAALDKIRDRGCALIVEAHSGHAAEYGGGKRSVRPRGSAALMGWPEFGLGIRRSDDDPTITDTDLVQWRGSRSARKWPMRMHRGRELPFEPAL